MVIIVILAAVLVIVAGIAVSLFGWLLGSIFAIVLFLISVYFGDKCLSFNSKREMTVTESYDRRDFFD